MEEPRYTILNLERKGPVNVWAEKIVDAGRRRFLSYGTDFDTRSIVLTEIQATWEKPAKEMWEKNKSTIESQLLREYGEIYHKEKVANFIAIRSAPFSILSYHNDLFHQVRRAFVQLSYYPSLVGACALGERMLNHLILDLREEFRATSEYKAVSRKDSFDNWGLAIRTLVNWGVLLPKVAEEFTALSILRHRSIHFNPATYTNLRSDALTAILHLRSIIEWQFGSFSDAPWFVKGTAGQVFIAKSWETNPFVRTFFLPTCPFVGPLFAIKFDSQRRPNFYDRADYGDGSWTDDEFADQFNNRKPEDVTGTD